MENESSKKELSITNEEQDAAKIKRRSKNDPEGRSFKCDICGKTYLSRPAVTQHVKTKHPDEMNKVKRNRGRPKKDDEVDTKANNREIFMESFFDKSIRVRGIENFDAENELILSLTSLYTDYKEILFKDWPSINLDYPILKIELTEEMKQNEIKTFDEAIIRFLNYMGSKTSKNYFFFTCKFIILFREFINIFKKGNEAVSHPFSEFNSPDSVPESCNEFIADFLDKHNFFGLEIIEVIESIQYFCNWLYNNGLTYSLLTLMSSNE